MSSLTTAQVMDLMDRQFLAAALWDALYGRQVNEARIRVMKGRPADYPVIPVSIEDLKAQSLTWDAVGVAKAELDMWKARFVDADDDCLQAILRYKEERATDRRALSYSPHRLGDRRRVADLDDRRRLAVRSVWKRSLARAKVHAAEARLVEAALDRIEQHWTPRAADPAHPYVNLGAAMAAE